jgi:hypothetical protein
MRTSSVAWRASAVGRAAAVAAALAALACGGPSAEELLKRASADRLREAAQSLRARAPAKEHSLVDLPRASWPAAFRSIAPKQVQIDKYGVSLVTRSFFVESEGLYIVFEGAAPPEEREGDPSFRKLSERVYWFQYTG